MQQLAALPFSCLLSTLRYSNCSFCVVKIMQEENHFYAWYTTISNKKQRVGELPGFDQFHFTFHLIRSSALPARPLSVVSWKPHGSTTYTLAKSLNFFYPHLILAVTDSCSPASELRTFPRNKNLSPFLLHHHLVSLLDHL